MRKNFKFAILVVSLALLCIYAVICWVVSATYQINLEKLVSTDEILHSQQFPSDNNEALFISVDEENVIFRKIVDKYLWPFSNAKYPSINCQYTLCLDDLSKSTYSEGIQSVVIGNLSEGIENSIIIKDYYTIEDVQQEYGFHPYYYGYCQDESIFSSVSTYIFNIPYREGNIILFDGADNPNFSDVNVPYFSISLN